MGNHVTWFNTISNRFETPRSIKVPEGGLSNGKTTVLFNEYVSCIINNIFPKFNYRLILILFFLQHRYSLMRECWHFDPDKRPAFNDIVQILDQILSQTSDKEYLDFGLPALETPSSSECDSDTDLESDNEDMAMNPQNQLTNSQFISRNMY